MDFDLFFSYYKLISAFLWYSKSLKIFHFIIANTFIQSFSDYSVPMKLSEEELITKMQNDRIDLKLSAGAFDGEELIGFILHGVGIFNNRKTAYNGGTGVISEYRGNALTRRLYEFIIPVLKKENIEQCLLEVIDSNIPALKTYKKTGFKITRKLVCFKGKIKTIISDTDLSLVELKNPDWNYMETFHDLTPCWQNSMETIKENSSGLTSNIY